MIFVGYILRMTTGQTLCDIGTAKKFQLVGGELCLDFANTMGGKRGAVPHELLLGYRDLLSWFQQAELVDYGQTKKLAREADNEPGAASRALARAIEFREALYRIFAAIIEKRQPARVDLEALNSELALTLGRLRVGPKGQGPGFAWRWSSLEGDLAGPLGPVARSAADLLTNERALPQVRRCGGDNCGWLFIDSSKNHSRRWCDMRDCGNRAKVRRHRMKQRRAA